LASSIRRRATLRGSVMPLRAIRLLLFQQPGHMDQLEGAIGVVECFGQQDFAAAFVILAQGAGQVFDPTQPDGDADAVAQAAFHRHVNLVAFDGRGWPERLCRLFQITEMVAVAAKDIVNGGFGCGGQG
jgi:hypothetical protein